VIARAVAFALALMACTACRPAPSTVERREALREVVLPDLANASPRVRNQVQQQYAALTASTGDVNTPSDVRATAYGDMGKLLMAAEYRNAAEACFLNARSLAPRDARWPYYLAHLYKARGEAAKSIDNLERAHALQPDDVPTLVWLGEAYLDRGQPEAAEALFAHALSRQPRSLAASFDIGRARLGRSDYAGAVQYLEQALALDPGAASIHYQLALAYRGLGNTEKAEAHMRQRGPGDIRPPDPLMLDLESVLESPVAYEVRGAKALDERDFKRAADAFRKGLELAPDEPSLHHKLGTALYLEGDAAAAAAEFETTLRLSPHFAKAHYSLGIMHGSSGRTGQAIEHLTAAIRDDPAYVEARVRLADVLRMNGQPQASLQHYEAAAATDPRIPDAPFGYALSLVDLGRYREARDRLGEGVERYPEHAGFAQALARLLAAAPDDRVRDGAAAMRLMQTLLAHQPRSYQFAETMAMTVAELGQYGEAASWQHEAIAGAERAGRSDVARRMAEALSRYERRQPCRTPWHRDDPPG
jgi:tetratricopeptide (TPR) repeat protein